MQKIKIVKTELGYQIPSQTGVDLPFLFEGLKAEFDDVTYYNGVLAVPISFLDKYNPDQFEILNCNDFRRNDMRIKSTMLIKDADAILETRGGEANLCTNLHQGKATLIWSPDQSVMVRKSTGGCLSVIRIIRVRDRYEIRNQPGVDLKWLYEGLRGIDAGFEYCSGIIGVPISFVDKYCSEQFEIISCSAAKDVDWSINLGNDYSGYYGYNKNGAFNGRTGSTFGNCPVLVKDGGTHSYYMNKAGVRVQATYHRIFMKYKEV